MDSENRWAAFDRSISGTFERIEMQTIPCTITKEEAEDLITARINARRQRDFDTADEIRKELADRGVRVVDRDNSWTGLPL